MSTKLTLRLLATEGDLCDDRDGDMWYIGFDSATEAGELFEIVRGGGITCTGSCALGTCGNVPISARL